MTTTNGTSHTTKPTILFIHGSWHTPNHYTSIRAVFESNGYPTVCPRHASAGAFPPIGLADDSQVIRNTLTDLITDKSQSVIVVAHSYGGQLASDAVHADFSHTTRQSQGKQGGVLSIIYMCAFILPRGLSISGAFNGNLPPWIIADEATGQCNPHAPEVHFYHDLAEKDQRYCIAELVPTPTRTQHDPIAYAAYLHHPVTYLFCENDQAMPHGVQQMMVRNVEEATGIKVRRESCSSSHSPFWSMPERVLEVVQGIEANRVWEGCVAPEMNGNLDGVH